MKIRVSYSCCVNKAAYPKPTAPALPEARSMYGSFRTSLSRQDNFQVLFSGSWEDDSIYLRASYRDWGTPINRVNNRSFRCVLEKE